MPSSQTPTNAVGANITVARFIPWAYKVDGARHLILVFNLPLFTHLYIFTLALPQHFPNIFMKSRTIQITVLFKNIETLTPGFAFIAQQRLRLL